MSDRAGSPSEIVVLAGGDGLARRPRFSRRGVRVAGRQAEVGVSRRTESRHTWRVPGSGPGTREWSLLVVGFPDGAGKLGVDPQPDARNDR